MPDAVSALAGQTVAGAVTVRDMGLCGMISLRGDFSDPAFRSASTTLSGTAFPAQGRVALGGEYGLAWMSPDEVLVMLPYAGVATGLAQIATALAGHHHLAVDVSDARAVIAVSGTGAREVLGKLAPVDLHKDAFQPGMFRRSRLGQVAAAFWIDDAAGMTVVCFRSVADYTFALLVQSAKDGPVGHY